MPFFIIGHLLSDSNIQKRISSKRIGLPFFLGTLFLFLEVFINYYFTSAPTDNLLSLILVCPFIFVYALNLDLSYEIDSKNLALISTAIYLIHPWVMNILKKIYVFDSILLFFLTIIVSFLLSLLIIKVNERIKILL